MDKQSKKTGLSSKMPQLEVDELGLYHRSYDDSVEEGDDEDKEVIANVLAWLKERSAADQEKLKRKSTSKGKALLKELIDAGLSLDRVSGIAGVAALKASSQKGPLIDAAIQIFFELWMGLENILAGRRVKTSLIIIGSIGAGAAIGALLGTFVVPGIGTAIGGAAGAFIASLLSAVGGTLGLSIGCAAVVGLPLGIQISKKVAKHERKYQLPKHITRKLKKETGITSKLATRMNGYLYNRSKSVTSPLIKKYYKILRRLLLKEVDPVAVEEAARFFCHELRLLRQEGVPADREQKIRYHKEISTVVEILNDLRHQARTTVLSDETRDEMKSVIKDKAITQRTEVKDAPPTPSKVTFSRAALLRDYPNPEDQLKVLREYVKTLEIPDKRVEIRAQDKNWAAKLWAAVSAAGYEPQLEQYFPKEEDQEDIVKMGKKFIRLIH